MEFSTLGLVLPLVRCVRRLHISSSNTTMPPEFLFLALHKSLRPRGSNDLLIAEDKQWRVAGEVAVQILKCATSGLGVEEVDWGC